MNTKVFGSFDPKSITGFLSTKALACGYYPFSRKDCSCRPKLSNSTIVTIASILQGALTSYTAMTKYILETYVTEDDISEIDAEILQFTQLSNTTPTEYKEALWNEAIGYNLVYNE